MKNFFSKLFKTHKRQGPKANGKGRISPSVHAAGINSSTASNVSSTGQKSASWFSNLQSKFKNQQSSKALDEVVGFIGSYLHCSDHQRNLLALWILHSHCFSALDYTPYLSVHSTKNQSGKTRCLQLLSLLCPNPALTASIATNNLSSRIHYSEQRPTFLLDQCHATVGSRRRSKNPVLRAILESGFQRGIGHTDRKGERALFSPKAFAGIGLLPEDLAERSIPIHLKRLPISVNLQHFRSETVEAEAQPLRNWLAFWGHENLQKLKSAPALDVEDFPSGIELSPRRKDLLEPLLQIARLLAGDWPRRIAEALTFVFQDQAQRERKHAIALLSELREAFSHYGQPERIATASLLIWLHHDPDAPWNQEGLITASRLAAILRPFNIFPRQQRKKGESNHRGYTMKDFLYTWDQLLPREPSLNRDTSRREPMPAPPKPTPADEAGLQAFKAGGAQPPQIKSGAQAPSPVSSARTVDASTQGPKANGQGLGLINKNAAGINSSTISGVSSISVNQRKSAADSGVADASTQGPKGSGQGQVLDPRIKGILDDPNNYYRQYPKDDSGKLRYLIEGKHQWPQPADDKLPPDAVYSMSDGPHIPFSLINRHPTDSNPILGLPQFFTQRWPVTLNTEERMQVAMARFYEILTAARAALQRGSDEAVSPNKNAAGINSSTTSEVGEKSASSVSNQKSTFNNQQSSTPPSPMDASSQGPKAKGQGLPLVPNPQPIPFPSQKELEAQGYRFGPFSPEHNPTDVEMIAYYAKRGYRPLQPHEVDFAEFRCNGVPFAKASDVQHRPKPPEPPQPQKSPEEAERDAIMAKIRRDRDAPPKCAVTENFRLAPPKR